jgi:hypothetical protein
MAGALLLLLLLLRARLRSAPLAAARFFIAAVPQQLLSTG